MKCLNWKLPVLFSIYHKTPQILCKQLVVCSPLEPLWSPHQEAVAQRRVWRQLRDRGSDAAQHLLPSSDPGPDGHHRSGGLPAGPQPHLLQVAGAQRRDPWHDPPRPGLPGRHNLPPRLQRLRDKPLTGPQGPPAPLFPSFTSPTHPIIETSSTFTISTCSNRGGSASAHMAAPSSDISASSAAQLQTDTSLPDPTAEPEPYVDGDVLLPLLSSLSSTANCDVSLHDFPKPGQRDYTLPRTRQPRRINFSENTSLYSPFRVYSSHMSALSDKTTASSFPPNILPTVASEPNSLTRSESNVIFQGSHLPRFPRSPYKHPDRHDSASAYSHAPSSSSLSPAPALPPCPTGPEEATAWGCCCSLREEATPLSRYLGKVGQAALPLLKVGELLNTEPSDVQTWNVIWSFLIKTPDLCIWRRDTYEDFPHTSLILLETTDSCVLKIKVLILFSELHIVKISA